MVPNRRSKVPLSRPPLELSDEELNKDRPAWGDQSKQIDTDTILQYNQTLSNLGPHSGVISIDKIRSELKKKEHEQEDNATSKLVLDTFD